MDELGGSRRGDERPLAPLIRAPTTRQLAPAITRSLVSLPAAAASDATAADDRRREKLRAILALMEPASQRRARRLGNKTSGPWSRLAEDVREGADGSGSALQRSLSRRHAITDGTLPIRSPRFEIGKSIAEEPEIPVRLRKFGKLRTIAKIIVLLLRMCRTYILTENDAKMVKLFSAIDAAQAGDKYKIRGDLLFDVTQYRAKKQNKISSGTRRVLETPTARRTDKDIHHVQVELQQMDFITKYPVHMQRSLIRHGAFETYETGRVIIRHGRRPYAFYLVLGGSAIALEGDPENSGRPATAVLKGHVFGHEAIVNRGRHNSTVISKETIQLLSLTVAEYSQTFLGGGVSNISGVDGSSFIESVSIFQGWPLHLLRKHPKKCRFNFFTRGTVIEKDSNASDWIYILKSGSCAVMKKLHHEEAVPAKRRRNLPAASPQAAASLAMGHEEHIARRLRDMQRKRAKALRGKSRRLQDTYRPTNLVRIPMRDDHLAADDSATEPAPPAEAATAPSSVPAILVSDSSRPVGPPPSAEPDAGCSSPEGDASPATRRPVVGRVTAPAFPRGPFLTHSRRLPDIKVTGQPPTAEPAPAISDHGHPSVLHPNTDTPTSSRTGDDTLTDPQQKHISFASHEDQDDVDTDQQVAEISSIGRDTFVQIDTLERGAIFGVSDIVFGRQPSLCLVSQGVECIMVAKRFYTRHATEANIKAITDLLRPYPSEDTLLRDLREKLTWRDHRGRTLSDTARSLRRHRRKSLAKAAPQVGTQAGT